MQGQFNTDTIIKEMERENLSYKIIGKKIFIQSKNYRILRNILPNGLHYFDISKDVYQIDLYEEAKIPNKTEIIEYCYELGERFIFLELNSKNFIKTSYGIILLNIDCIILRREIIDAKFIIQVFCKAFNDKKYLFIDKRTKKSIEKEEILNKFY